MVSTVISTFKIGLHKTAVVAAQSALFLSVDFNLHGESNPYLISGRAVELICWVDEYKEVCSYVHYHMLITPFIPFYMKFSLVWV